MKCHISLFAVFLTLTPSCNVNAFQNRRVAASAMKLKAASQETAAPVTKDDLLAARDAVDQLLREKACGMYMYCIHYSVVSGIVSYRIVSQFGVVHC